ncbi:site-specific integrase [Erysipelothrix rhusiopathiae]|nr:site-specific integrase [Erysipelothrix rhusiopathiae]
MSAYKDKKTGKWVVTLRYTDIDGKEKRRAKRGFLTKREAKEWETEYLSNLSNEVEIDMSLNEFYEVYLSDISNKLRYNTIKNKRVIYDKYIQPYLGSKKLAKISTPDIIKWQNEILGFHFKDTYARSINNQLVAIFNHAERFYELQRNPLKKTTAIGSKHPSSMNFWTKEEFDKFISVVDDESSRLQFNVLFYTGIRVGELIAVRLKNINFEQGHIEIRHSAQYENGKYIFTKPKTKKSERVVTIPQFLTQMIENYVDRYYFIDMEEQVFMTNKSRLSRELEKYAKIANVKRIRIHDLRHSHASLLIEQGIQPNIVQDRLGHEKIETTLRTYSHLYPNKQYHLASFLDQIASNDLNNTLSSNNQNPIMIETIK